MIVRNYLRYLTRITYIFPKNSSNFQRGRTRISARTCSDFPHDTVWKNLDRNSARLRAENGESHLCHEVACEAEPFLLRLQRYTYSIEKGAWMCVTKWLIIG